MNFFSQIFTPKKTVTNSLPPVFIIGLGNPGKKYANTRHNLGFLALEYIQKEWVGSVWRLEKKFQAEISDVTYQGRKIVLVKPMTFMNHSGASVQSLLNFYKATPAASIVLHDEVDIPFGNIKTTLSSRAAGHNGVKDIIEHLGTQDFRRVRLGVGKGNNPNISVSDHVLTPFTPDEQSKLSTMFKESETLLKAWL